jgi:hypothetical protein
MKKEINPASLVAVIPLGNGRVKTAVITSRTMEGMPTIEVTEYDEKKVFRPAVDEQGEPTGGNENIADQPFRLSLGQRAFIAPDNFSFGTRTLALLPETAELSDVDLAAYLIQAEQSGAMLGDGKMLLGDLTLESQVAQITRLPNDAVALTEMPRSELNSLTETIRNMYFPVGISDEKRQAFSDKIPAPVAETQLRAAFRAYLVESRPADNNLLTVFVLATESGFAFGCWNASWGLFRELSESMPDEFSMEETLFTDEESEEIRNNSLAGFYHHALNNAFQSASDTAEEYGFAGIEKIVLAVPLYSLGITEPIVQEFSDLESVEVMLIPESIDNQILRGLLYSQIEFNPLVEANLCRDLYARYLDNSIAEEQRKKQRQAERKRQVMTAMVVPACLMLGFMLGSVFYQLIASGQLKSRNTAADKETARLKPILDARNSYIPNFNYRESYIRQTLGKKDQQTVAISFLPEVDKKYALASADSKFSLSNIKLENTGVFEMKGIATNEDMVTQFVRGLENAANEKDEKRIFTNLTFEVRRGTKEKQAANANFKSQFSNIPPGYIGWMVKGGYAPLSAIAVPVKTNQPPPPPPPAANQNPAPPVSPTAK